MKKLIPALLVLIGVLFTFSADVYAQSSEIPFSDHEGHVYQEAIEYLFDHGII